MQPSPLAAHVLEATEEEPVMVANGTEAGGYTLSPLTPLWSAHFFLVTR